MALQRQLPEALRDDARYLLGRSFIETEQYADAIQAFQPLIMPGQRGRWVASALYWTGEALLSEHDFAGATQHLQRFIDSYPDSEHLQYALYALGYAHQKANAPAPGLQAFQQLIERFPQSQLRSAAEYGVARALVSLQRFAEAAPYWQSLGQASASPEQAEEATFWWAESWTRAGRCDQARPAFQEYLRRFPRGSHGADALNTVATCAHHAGDFAAEIAALEALVQSPAVDTQGDPLLLRLAEAYEQTGELMQAHARYSQWLLAFPDNPRRTEVLSRRGSISRQQGHYAQAVADFVEVLERAEDSRQRNLAHAMLAESYFRLDDCVAAQPHLAAVIDHGDQAAQQQARLRRGVCTYRNKRYAVVVEDLGALADDAEFRGDRQTLLLLLAQSLAAINRDVEAITRFRQFFADAPASEATAQALAGLGASLLKVGNVGEALPVYEQLLIVAPDLAAKERLHLQVGLLYRQRQVADRAKQHLEAAIPGDPSVGVEALYQLSDLLLEEGATEQAMAMLRQLTTQFASQERWVGIASYRLALLYESAERWPEAWQAYLATAKAVTDPKLVEAARKRAQYLEETVDVHARREPAPSQAEHNP